MVEVLSGGEVIGSGRVTEVQQQLIDKIAQATEAMDAPHGSEAWYDQAEAIGFLGSALDAVTRAQQ